MQDIKSCHSELISVSRGKLLNESAAESVRKKRMVLTMAEMAGNSNAITRRYLDSLLIETRYMNSTFPDTEMTLYGKKFKTPVMTAALSHLDHFMFEGATAQYAEGAA